MLERLRKRQRIGFNVAVSLTLVALLVVSVVFGISNYLTENQIAQTQSKLMLHLNDLGKINLQQQESNAQLSNQIDDLNKTNLQLQENSTRLSGQLEALNILLLDNTKSLQANLNSMNANYATLFANLTSAQSTIAELGAQQNALQNRPQPVEPFDYLVYSNGSGNYVAENGATLAIDYSGNNASKVCQNCIDTLLSKIGGGKIILAGTINLSGPLVITQGLSNGTIEIDGYGPSTRLVVPNNQDGIDLFGEQAFGYGGPYHAIINGILLTTGSPPQGQSMASGIHVKNWFDISIQNVMVFYANDSGIQIEESADVKLQNVYVEGSGGVEYGGSQPLLGAGISIIGSKDCYLDNCYSDTNNFGFLIEANPKTSHLPNNIFLSECEATLCEQTGISIGSANGFVLSDSLVTGSSGDGVDIVDSLSVTVSSTVIQGNSGNGLAINSHSLITVQNCNINANGKNGIGIYSQNNIPISYVEILGCQITNSGAIAEGSQAQPYVWDGININTDVNTGGNCTNIQISNCFIGNQDGTTPTQNFGVRSLGNSDYLQVFQNDFFNNLAGNYSLVGTHNSVANNFQN